MNTVHERARVLSVWVWVVIIGVPVIGIAAAWLLVPWEWSMIDDPGFVLSVREQTDEHGFLPGLVQHAWSLVLVDLEWGLFRPAYWVYPSLVYWLPIGVAHLLRLVMLVIAMAGPLVALRRRGSSWLVVTAAGLIMLSAASSLFQGLFYLSLQELSGATFVGLGLMARSARVRIGLWVVAAWFKAPFVWLLVGEAIILWRAGRRRLAVVTLGFAGVTIVASALMAREGSYTRSYALGIGTLERAAANLPLLLDLGALLAALAFLWWLVAARTRPSWSAYSFVLLIGWLGYTAQMLPWSVIGHYQGGMDYLLAVLLGSMLVNPSGLSGFRTIVALTVPVVTASLAVVLALGAGLVGNARIRGITDCIQRAGSVDVLLAKEFGPEAAVRLGQNLQIRDDGWQGTVVYEDAENRFTPDTQADVLVIATLAHSPVEVSTQVLCEVPGAQVLRVVQ